MRKSLSTVCLVLVLLFGVSAIAADKVVVVPLGGAVGNATVEDVVRGKTFSNSMEKGLTGTLKLTPAPTGDAVAADVLEDKTFSSKEGHDIPGTMYNNGAGSIITPSQTGKQLNPGYWSSSNYIQGDLDLVGENIPVGITIFGIEGGLKCVKSQMGLMSGTARVECDFACDITYPLQGAYWHGCHYGCYLSNLEINDIFDNNCE